MKSFAGILSKQLSDFGKDISCTLEALKRFGNNSGAAKAAKTGKGSNEYNCIGDDGYGGGEEDANSCDDIGIGVIHAKFHDTVGCKHWVAQYPTIVGTSGKRYTKARRCNSCGKSTCCFC